ncbi:Type II secretion system (T2SS), protein F [uncultured archaeon]|nr:Type II secretion system (T2SS), protein F [uncultured archaeon]
MSDEKLKNIKEIILAEKSKDENKIEDIVERLKKTNVKPEDEAKHTEEIIKMNAAKEANVKIITPDLSRNDEYETFSKLYAKFKGPLDKLVTLFSQIMNFEELQNELNSAKINLRPESYVVYGLIICFVAGTFFTLISVLAGILLSSAIFLNFSLLIGVAGAAFSLIFILNYPHIAANNRSKEIDQVLPYALRQLATQIKAGVGFTKAIESIAKSNYGVLSEEFKIVSNDLKAGSSIESALTRLMNRTGSSGLKKVIIQIIRSMKTGGKLSDVISSIASDVSFEARMAVRDYTEVLNLISVFYIVVAVVAPVSLSVFSAILKLPIIGTGLPIPSWMLFGIITLGIIVILYVIKYLEPKS